MKTDQLSLFEQAAKLTYVELAAQLDSIIREYAPLNKPTDSPKFKVGQYVERCAIPGCGKTRGLIRSVSWCPEASIDLKTGIPRGGYVINLDNGNYGGELLFSLVERV